MMIASQLRRTQQQESFKALKCKIIEGLHFGAIAKSFGKAIGFIFAVDIFEFINNRWKAFWLKT